MTGQRDFETLLTLSDRTIRRFLPSFVLLTYTTSSLAAGLDSRLVSSPCTAVIDFKASTISERIDFAGSEIRSAS